MNRNALYCNKPLQQKAPVMAENTQSDDVTIFLEFLFRIF